MIEKFTNFIWKEELIEKKSYFSTGEKLNKILSLLKGFNKKNENWFKNSLNFVYDYKKSEFQNFLVKFCYNNQINFQNFEIFFYNFQKYSSIKINEFYEKISFFHSNSSSQFHSFENKSSFRTIFLTNNEKESKDFFTNFKKILNIITKTEINIEFLNN